jgi:hypothetical protein
MITTIVILSEARGSRKTLIIQGFAGLLRRLRLLIMT